MGEFENERMDDPKDIKNQENTQEEAEETGAAQGQAPEESSEGASADELNTEQGGQAEENGDAEGTEEEVADCEACEEDTEDADEEEASGEAPGDSEDAPSGGDKAEGQQKKGFFARRKEKKDRKDQQIEELQDRVRRQLAEFENFRKRTEREKATSFESGARSVLEKILPVVDSFERGLGAAGEDPEDPYAKGMQMIYKQLMTTLEGMEVKPIEAVGQEFDPELHNAVMHTDDDSVGENIIVEELQKGYKYRDSVLRYSMVKVAN